MQTKALRILNNIQSDGLKSSDGNFKPRKKREPVSVGRIATYVVLGLYTLWILAPFMIILISSFTPRSEFETLYLVAEGIFIRGISKAVYQQDL